MSDESRKFWISVPTEMPSLKVRDKLARLLSKSRFFGEADIAIDPTNSDLPVSHSIEGILDLIDGMMMPLAKKIGMSGFIHIFGPTLSNMGKAAIELKAILATVQKMSPPPPQEEEVGPVKEIAVFPFTSSMLEKFPPEALHQMAHYIAQTAEIPEETSPA